MGKGLVCLFCAKWQLGAIKNSARACKGLTPNNSNQTFPSTWCFRNFWLVDCIVFFCLFALWSSFCRRRLGRRSQPNGKFPFMPKRTVSGLFKRTGKSGTYKYFYEVAIIKCAIKNMSSILEAWISWAVECIWDEVRVWVFFIAFLQMGKGWLELAWTIMAMEAIRRQVRIILSFFIRSSLFKPPSQILLLYKLYFLGPDQKTEKKTKIILRAGDIPMYRTCAAIFHLMPTANITNLSQRPSPLTPKACSESFSTEDSKSRRQSSAMACKMLATC